MAPAPFSKMPGLKLGLGLLSIGRPWGVGQSPPPTEGEAQALLAKAVELGIAIFDTAPAYGQSEARLGSFLSRLEASRRKPLIVMTKAGEHWDPQRGATFVDHRRDALIRSIDRSLELLGSVDVLQIHKATVDVVAHPDVIAAMEHARRCGVAVFGASISDLEAGRMAVGSGLYQALQFPLNPSQPGLAELAPVLERSGCAAIVNRPFAMGGLIMGKPVASSGAAAFRFIEARLPNAVVLTGTGRVSHLVENVAAFRDCST